MKELTLACNFRYNALKILQGQTQTRNLACWIECIVKKFNKILKNISGSTGNLQLKHKSHLKFLPQNTITCFSPAEVYQWK